MNFEEQLKIHEYMNVSFQSYIKTYLKERLENPIELNNHSVINNSNNSHHTSDKISFDVGYSTIKMFVNSIYGSSGLPLNILRGDGSGDFCPEIILDDLENVEKCFAVQSKKSKDKKIFKTLKI